MELIEHIPVEVIQLLTSSEAVEYRLLPYEKVEMDIRCYGSVGRDYTGVVEELAVLYGWRVSVVPISDEELQHLLTKYYRTDAGGGVPVTGRLTDISSGQGFLMSLVGEAFRDYASDIHLEPYENRCRIRFRIDGKLTERYVIERTQYTPLVNQIKILANLDISEKRLPQDGRILYNRDGNKFDVRVSSLPTIYGEKIVLRLLTRHVELLELRNLGFSERQYDDYCRAIRRPFGMVLICGPTGSGKSTTLYATLRRLNATTENILTIEIKPFPDLNSLILSGDNRDVARVTTFLRSIDKPVPMITMEIIIADVTKSDIREAGMEAGVGKSPTKTSGTLGAGVDMTFSASAVNSLLQRIRGTVNLGRVTPNFYLSLKALEENGTIRLQSTPKLSTLNGHDATLTSGEKQYYKEIQNNYYGTQNPIQSESYTWKSVDANLSIKVTPYVSEDRHITLEIEFEQTEFTDRSTEEAPPATATRSFKSIVKVQNEEMVLLGGLDRNTFEKSSRGIPFLARVPVIKWFFGKEKRNKVDRSLNVFIKPTVIE